VTLLLAVRQEIAAALTTVSGITGYADPPSIMAPGGAWPLLVNLTTADHLPAGVFLAQWRIILITGGTPEDGLTFLDAQLVPVLAALAPHGWITTVTPVTIETTSSGTLYGAEITLVRE
jgi:hypothetical protein